MESLERAGIQYDLYDRTRVEPTDTSFEDCIQFARSTKPDAFLGITDPVADLFSGGNVFDRSHHPPQMRYS